MVLTRRNHARPTRRRHLVGIVALVSVVFYIVYVWNPFFSSSRTSSSSILPFSPPPPSLLPANGGPYRADAFPGDPSKWRDPQRDFDAEYEEVVAAVPSLQGTRPARLAFLIMAHGPTDVKLLKRSLPWLYSPLNFFLVGDWVGGWMGGWCPAWLACCVAWLRRVACPLLCIVNCSFLRPCVQ